MLPDPPLFGRRVLVTRPAGDASELSAPLRAAGADVICIPAFRVAAVDPSPLDGRLREGVASYDAIVFTSRNAVRYFFEAASRAGVDPARVDAAAVGPSTARALERRGIRARVVGEPHTAEGLVDALVCAYSRRGGVRGRRFLYPMAADARDVIERKLAAHGAIVDAVIAYGAVPEVLDDPESAGRSLVPPPDVVTFASPTAVVHLAQTLTRAVYDQVEDGLKTRSLAACIGPVTEDTARRHGYRVEIVADTYTAAGLVDAVVRHFAKEG